MTEPHDVTQWLLKSRPRSQPLRPRPRTIHRENRDPTQAGCRRARGELGEEGWSGLPRQVAQPELEQCAKQPPRDALNVKCSIGAQGQSEIWTALHISHRQKELGRKPLMETNIKCTLRPTVELSTVLNYLGLHSVQAQNPL